MTIERVTDVARVQDLLHLANEATDTPSDLNLDWLRTKNWVVVPVESAYHFTDSHAALLARAFQKAGCKECFAVATEPAEYTSACYWLPATHNGLLEFSRECGSFNYLLLPADHSSAVLCTSEDFFIIAGPRDFVVGAVGAGIEEARNEFLDFARAETWPPVVREGLLNVYERYSEFS